MPRFLWVCMLIGLVYSKPERRLPPGSRRWGTREEEGLRFGEKGVLPGVLFFLGLALVNAAMS